jgi:hypothetical protein
MDDGRCPKCEQLIEVRTRKGLFGIPPDLASGFIVICPRCDSILGFLPNPESIAQAVAQESSQESHPQSAVHFTFKDPES